MRIYYPAIFRYYTDTAILDRVPSCFLLLGSCYAVLQLIGSMLISFPAAEPNDDYTQVKDRGICCVML